MCVHRNVCVLCLHEVWRALRVKTIRLHTCTLSLPLHVLLMFPRPSYSLIAVTSRHMDRRLLPKRCYIFAKARPDFPTAWYLCHRRSNINSFCPLSLPSLIFFLIKTWVFFFLHYPCPAEVSFLHPPQASCMPSSSVLGRTLPANSPSTLQAT